jgi:hypothetical protein
MPAWIDDYGQGLDWKQRIRVGVGQNIIGGSDFTVASENGFKRSTDRRPAIFDSGQIQWRTGLGWCLTLEQHAGELFHSFVRLPHCVLTRALGAAELRAAGYTGLITVHANDHFPHSTL